jgi:outer membrane lipoprotein SlyB
MNSTHTTKARKSWDTATLASGAISLILVSVIGLAACGPQGGDPLNKPVATAATPAPVAVAPVAREPRPAPRPVLAEGRVVGIEPITEQGKPSGAGAVIGGVLGAVAGNQIGDGNGRRVATVAGAAGGAFAGNHIEKNRKQTIVGYHVRVEMSNGDERTFRESSLDGLNVGDRVRVQSGLLQRV